MDDERFQQIEKRLNEQAEATRAMNETLNKFIAIMGNQEAARNVAPPPLVSPPHVTTPLQASQPSRVKPGIPSHFDGDRAQGRAFLTSCELYISLTQLDFIDEQVRIHWALSRADTQQASPSAFYGRNYGLERCASHPGMTLLRNSRRHSAQRTRQLQPSCDSNPIDITKANGM
jgi:hypothetical protein